MLRSLPQTDRQTDRHDKTYIPRITDFGGIKTPSAVVEWFIISLRDEKVKRHL